MADLARIIVRYEYDNGGPGVNVLHFSPGTASWSDDSAQELVDEVAASWVVMRDLMASVVAVYVETTMRVIDSDTGELTAIYTAAADPGAINCTGSGTSLSRATQVCAHLRTSDFVRGRQLRGRVFMGPAAAESIATNGQIASTVPAVVTSGFAALITGLGPRLAVWSRPIVNPDTGAIITPGTYGDVTTVGTMSRPAVLRSRRD